MSRSSTRWRRLLALGGLGISLLIQAGCHRCLEDVFDVDSSCSVQSAPVCPNVVMLYRVPLGTYTVVNADVLGDTCNSGLTGAQLRDEKVSVNLVTATGAITLTDADGHELGEGPVRCNFGVLSTQELVLKSGMCSYTARRVSQLMVAFDGVLSVQVIETRAAATGTCGTMPASCQLSYQITLRV